MQFLEHSVIGLRSARHQLLSPSHATRITLFPMVHVGEAEFYRTVYADAATHDAVLLEGVKSRVVRRLTRAYRWAGAGRLGLVVQPKPGFSGTPCRAVHADLTAEEFEAAWRDVPLRLRLALAAGASGVGLWLRLCGSRERLGRSLNMTDVPDRDLLLTPEPVLRSLLSLRDARLCERLKDEIERGSGSVAVIFGAAHMAAVVHFLSAFGGYRPAESTWIDIYRY